MSAALQLGQRVGQAVACRALGVPRATLYRHMQPAAPRRIRPTGQSHEREEPGWLLPKGIRSAFFQGKSVSFDPSGT